MGNTDSSPISSAVTSSLSPEAHKRLQHASLALRNESNPAPSVASARPIRPPMNAFFEAAAVAHASGANVRKPPRRKASSTNSTLSRGTNSSLKVNTNTARDDSVISVTPHGSTSHPLLPVTSPTSSFAPTALTETETATTTCFTSSLTTRTDSVVIGGRRYLHQKKESYVLPLDDEESDRLIVMHFLLKHAFESNFMAPVASVLQEGHPEGQISKVLDIGCGPGTWILEMATDYPNAEFYGVDFYPMFPTTIKPNNTHFQQHDIFESPLPFSDASFDYIYMRTMLICMTRKKLAQILTEIARILKPGGYLEMVDMEYHIQRPGPISEYLINQKFYDTMRAHAIDLYLTHQMSTLLMTQPSDGGFVDIQQQRVAIPLGWGGPLGEVHSQNIGSLLSSLNPTLCRPQTSPLSPPLTPTTPGVGGQGLDATTIQQVLEECKRYQSHLNWHVCFGRKSTVGSSNLHHGSRQDSLHFSTSYSCLSTTASTTAAASTKAAVASTASTATSSSQANDASYLEDGAWDLINDFVYGFTD